MIKVNFTYFYISACESENVSCSVMSDSLSPYGLQPTSLLCPWNFPGKNIGVVSHFRLQGIFLLFILSVVSENSLQPHALQPARLPCPSLSPGVYSNSCSLSRWCHPTVLSSVALFSSCPQSFPASGSFPMSWLFASGGQSVGASASVSVLPINIQS